MTKVSVCIITYNHEPYIAQAIESTLMQQTDFPFEVIIGEDDSTDKTRAIVKVYAQRFPEKIRLFLNERKDVIHINGRPTGRWNLVNVLKQARGQYIALCEGDDYWTDPAKLQKQVAFLEANPAYAGSFHETKSLAENGALEKFHGRDAPEIVFAADTIAVASLFHTSSFLFRTEALSLPEWFFQIGPGDMALFSIVAASGPLKKVPEVMSIYRAHPGGVTRSASWLNNRYQERIELINQLNLFHNLKYDAKTRGVIHELNSQKDGKKKPKHFMRRIQRALRLRTRIRRLLYAG